MLSVLAAATSSRLPAFVRPAQEALSADERDTMRESRGFLNQARKISPSANRAAKSFEREIARLERRQEKLEAELGDALPIERKTIGTSLRQVARALQEKRENLRDEHRAISIPKASAERLESAFAHREKTISQILKVYPEAQIVDLSCLTLFKGKDGLPALALYGLNSPLSRVRLRKDEFEINSRESLLSKEERIALALSVQVATGVQLRAEWSPEWRSPALIAEIKKAMRQKTWKGEKDGRLPASATEIALVSNFGEGGRVIPRSSREIIRKAVDSKLFDEVVLLAETKSWRITYTDLRHAYDNKPFLRGATVTTPRTEDPLVLGLKKAGNQTLAILVHAFDTTQLEEYVRREFAVKADKKD